MKADRVTVHSSTAPDRPRNARRPKGRPQSAQGLWLRATAAAAPIDQHDELAVVLDLLRAARHDPVTISHALMIGRARMRRVPLDLAVRRGVDFLEQALAFMGADGEGGNPVWARRRDGI